MRCHVGLLLSVFVLTTACSKTESADTPEPGQTADSAISVIQPEARSTATTETTLVGEWSLSSAPAQRLPGIQLTVTVDSAAGSALWGRLTSYFAGNMGTSPDIYQPFSGSIDADSSISFSILPTDSDYLGIVFSGKLASDSIVLDTFVLGPDTMTNGNLRWALVKNR